MGLGGTLPNHIPACRSKFWPCEQLLQDENKFFDSSTSSIKNIDNGEEKKERLEKKYTLRSWQSLPKW